MRYAASLAANGLGIVFLLVFGASLNAADPPKAELVFVRRIWDRAEHNAFTDLIRHNDVWYCVFREGKAHVSPDGALRVLTSADGEKWESAALVSMPGADLRDAKITVTPEGKLMLSGAKATDGSKGKRHQTLVWFSSDGKEWGEPTEIGHADFWLWRPVWHEQTCYAIGYGTRADNRFIRLYQSNNGKQFEPLVEKLYEEGYPNESAFVFLEDNTAYCLLRRDGQPSSGLLGIAKPPYTQWEWKDLAKKIGGPHMIRLPDGRIVAAVRLYDGAVRTSLCWIDPDKGTLSEFLKLPSGGDTSYAGMVWHGDLVWVSYYSSHEGKTSVYLGRVKIQ